MKKLEYSIKSGQLLNIRRERLANMERQIDEANLKPDTVNAALTILQAERQKLKEKYRDQKQAVRADEEKYQQALSAYHAKQGQKQDKDEGMDYDTTKSPKQ